MCVKKMNDTLGPGGPVPFALLFGAYSATDIFEKPRELKPTIQQRVQLANSIHLEMEKQLASIRVNRALLLNIPTASDATYEVGYRYMCSVKNTSKTELENGYVKRVAKTT